MSASKKLSLAVKALHLLNSKPDEALSSLQISEKLNVNPSKLRRILSMLVKTGLIGSTKGVNGGFTLKKPAERIDLQEVYCSVEEKKAFYLDFHNNTEGDTSSDNMNTFFLNLFAEVQVVIEDYMRKISIEDITQKVKN